MELWQDHIFSRKAFQAHFVSSLNDILVVIKLWNCEEINKGKIFLPLMTP
jgi:hypothetical protein